MIFIAFAMLYYGLILFKLRRITKISDAKMDPMENDGQLTDSVIRSDHRMLVIYVAIFIFFNVCYFIFANC